jgi:uncharacterized MAPEG superfamily protein
LDPRLKVYAICLVILFFKMTAIALYQSSHRIRKNAYTNPEDAKAFGKGAALPGELAEVDKASKAYRNDLENIPIFLFLALIYVMLDCWEQGAVIYFWTFTVARVFHTVCYIRGIQPWRTMSYTVGAVMSAAVALHILAKVLL